MSIAAQKTVDVIGHTAEMGKILDEAQDVIQARADGHATIEDMQTVFESLHLRAGMMITAQNEILKMVAGFSIDLSRFGCTTPGE